LRIAGVQAQFSGGEMPVMAGPEQNPARPRRFDRYRGIAEGGNVRIRAGKTAHLNPIVSSRD